MSRWLTRYAILYSGFLPRRHSPVFLKLCGHDMLYPVAEHSRVLQCQAIYRYLLQEYRPASSRIERKNAPLRHAFPGIQEHNGLQGPPCFYGYLESSVIKRFQGLCREVPRAFRKNKNGNPLFQVGDQLFYARRPVLFVRPIHHHNRLAIHKPEQGYPGHFNLSEGPHRKTHRLHNKGRIQVRSMVGHVNTGLSRIGPVFENITVQDARNQEPDVRPCPANPVNHLTTMNIPQE